MDAGVSPRDRILADCHRIARELGMIIEHDDKIKKACIDTAVFAESSITTTYRGSPGTGKDLFPHMYHELARTQSGKGSYFAVNLAALNDHLFESELFGHKKGAFTGATQDRPSVFEQAGNGTVHLDEIGSLSLNLQSKLLRLIQNREVTSVGSNECSKITCTIICSTNKNLEQMVENNEFLEDLYDRIVDGHIFLPDWNERSYEHRMAIVEECTKKHEAEIDDEAREKLLNIHVRGNVREIASIIRRSAAYLVLRDDARIIGLPEVTRALETGSWLRSSLAVKPKAG